MLRLYKIPHPSWSTIIPTRIFVVRHGNVPHHQGDVAILPEGKIAAFKSASQIADQMSDSATVIILHAPTARTRETAQAIARGLEAALREQNKNDARVAPPQVETAIRNFHFILDGICYPPTDAMHESLPAIAAQNSFLQGFWQSIDDPIGYWLTHPSPSAESPATVAQRLLEFFARLLDHPTAEFYILVTHSGPMRAFLRTVFGADPGEPEYCEMFQVNASGVYYRHQSQSIPNTIPISNL